MRRIRRAAVAKRMDVLTLDFVDFTIVRSISI
jgi:hypothetical protein